MNEKERIFWEAYAKSQREKESSPKPSWIVLGIILIIIIGASKLI